MRIILQFALPAIVLAVAVSIMTLLANAKDDVIPVDPILAVPIVQVMTPVTQAYQPVIRTYGEVRARRRAALTSQVGGRVEWVSNALIPGAFLIEGQELLRIDRADYEVALTLADANLVGAETALALETALGEASAKEYASAGRGEPSDLVLRKPQRAQALAQVAAAQASVTAAKLNLQRTLVVAPFGSRVRMESVALGQVVQPGQQLGELASTDVAEVRVLLRDLELEHLDLPMGTQAQGSGAPVTLTANITGEQRTWAGSIDRIDGELDPTSRMAVAYVSVSDPFDQVGSTGGFPLLSGLFVDVLVNGRMIQGAQVLPRHSLQPGGKILVMVDANEAGEGKLSIRTPNIVFQNRESVVVTSGLQPGDQVITSPLTTAVEGMPIRLLVELQALPTDAPIANEEAPQDDLGATDAEGAQR
jgi:RND family efflux transporter MFP subunit